MFSKETLGSSQPADRPDKPLEEHEAGLDKFTMAIEARLLEALDEARRKAALSPDHSQDTMKIARHVLEVAKAIKAGVISENHSIEAMRHISKHGTLEGFIPSVPNFGNE